jgi:GT2 family glycosyltransferase
MNQPPLVYIILLNWNGWKDTIECLESLYQQTYENLELLVVDNDSKDQSVQKIHNKFPEIRLHQNSENLGYAGGNNAGIRIALEEQADYIWILNNDTVMAPDALEKLVKKMEEDQSIGLCGSTLIYADQRDTIQALGGGTFSSWSGTTKNRGDGLPFAKIDDHLERAESLDFIAGASILASRAFVEEVGLMNEEYFLYYEEMDWAERAKGWFKLGYAPESIVFHKEGASTKANRADPASRSLSADFYQLRNRLKFTRNYYPVWLPTVYITVWAAFFKRLLRGEWSRLPMILGILFGLSSKRYKG